MEDVICPECEARFTVTWSNSIDTQGGPQYCPFCGSEMNYILCTESLVHGPKRT